MEAPERGRGKRHRSPCACATRCETALSHHEPIAVIGIGCRFPGRANGPEQFWRLLEDGVDAVTDIPPDRWNPNAFHDPDPSRPGKTYSRRGGFVEDVDAFDPRFFGISPREAARMDPNGGSPQVSYEGLEDAGLRLEAISGSRAAVFVGISGFDYSLLQISFRDRGDIDVHSNTGGSLSIAANRISYSFDFQGPSAPLIRRARRHWWPFTWLAAASGRTAARWHSPGVSTCCSCPTGTSAFAAWVCFRRKAGAAAFDAGASGFVRSEGAGMVVLKPLAQALADGDRVYATIRGTAMNQDGRTPGMTVPSQEAQEDLLRPRALTRV